MSRNPRSTRADALVAAHTSAPADTIEQRTLAVPNGDAASVARLTAVEQDEWDRVARKRLPSVLRMTLADRLTASAWRWTGKSETDARREW